MSARHGAAGLATVTGVVLGVLGAGAAWAQASGSGGPPRPTKPQAAAAVAEYRQTREGCASPGLPCDEAAKQRFVETMNCVVRGQRGFTGATLDEGFTAYVDLVSEVMDTPGPVPQGGLGPCFAGMAPPGGPRMPEAVGPARAGAAPAAAEGPSVEALRKFQKQAEQQSRPVTPTSGGADSGEHERLKRDLEAMRQRLKSGTGPARVTDGAPAPAPGPIR